MFYGLEKLYIILLIIINFNSTIQSEILKTNTTKYHYGSAPLTVRCPIYAYSTANISWFAFNNIYKKTPIYCNSSGIICDNKSLTVQNIENEYEFYQCSVCGETQCRSWVNRFKYYNVHINSGPEKEVALHKNEFVECSSTYFGVRTSFIWYRHTLMDLTKSDSENKIIKMENGLDIFDHDFRPKKMAVLYEKYEVKELKNNEDWKSVLTFRNVTAANEGWYSCAFIMKDFAFKRKVKSFYLKVVNSSNVISPKNRIEENKITMEHYTREGQYFILSCPWKENVSIEIFWYHNEKLIECVNDKRVLCTEQSLLVEDVKSTDAGSYKCRINGTELMAHRVDVQESQINLSLKPEKITSQINKTVNFECDTGNSETGVTWLKIQDESAVKLLAKANCTKIFRNKKKYSELFKELKIQFLNNTNNKMLKLANTQPEDSGWYTCHAYNSLNFQRMATAMLSVEYSPEFIKTTNTQVIYIKEESHAICETKGNPKPQLKCYRDGEELPHYNGTGMIDCSENKLLLKLPSTDLTGKYKCISNNSYGSIECNRDVIVLRRSYSYKPINTKFYSTAGPIDRLLGQNATIECGIEKKYLGVKIAWFKLMLKQDVTKDQLSEILIAISATNSQLLSKDYDAFLKLLRIVTLTMASNYSDGMYKESLNLYNLGLNDEAWYSCILYSGEWVSFLTHYGFGSVYLSVIDGSIPKFISSATNQSYIEVSKSFVLNCSASGKPHPTNITWYRNLTEILCDERVSCVDHALKIHEANFEDSSRYRCEVCNIHGCINREMNVQILKKQTNLPKIILISTFSIILLLIPICYGIYIFVKKYKKFKTISESQSPLVQKCTKIVLVRWPENYTVTDNNSELITPIIEIEEQNQYLATYPDQVYMYEHDAQWEILRTNIVIGRVLGEGFFGRVMMGHTTNLNADNGSPIERVAVKMLKDDPTENDVKNLVYEMEIMKVLGGQHINIVNFLGCCSQNGPLWVVVEYAEHGNLKDFLQKPKQPWFEADYVNRIESAEQILISFAHQIASGMDYLISKRCIHRDLAARNILVASNFIMKISDFGLARDLKLSDYYRKNQNALLPVKWMAPESLVEPIFTSANDIWSYGVLLWEIMSHGAQPYPNVTTIIQLLTLLQRGDRLAKPKNCSDNIYRIMLDCWNIVAEDRPNFHQIETKLSSLIAKTLNESSVDTSSNSNG